MFGSRHALNPHANSFIPSTKSDVIREMAVKSVTELWQKKKANGERTVTNDEIAKLVGHFISISFKELENSDKVKIQNYLNKKLLSSKIPIVRPVSDLCRIRSNLSKQRTTFESFDLKKFKIPSMPFLLTAFWGLYRHEQAQRPLLSLTYRPELMKNKIWSVHESDKVLWNQSCAPKVCECPPIFGYTIPSSFFGLSFLLHSCHEQEIHLNHYPESSKGNEFILTHNWQHVLMDELPFEDEIEYTNKGAGVDTLKNQFQSTVSGICSILEKFAEEPDIEIEDNEIEDNKVEETDYYASLWDDSNSKISRVPIFQQSRDTLFDDNDHPLLEVSENCLEQRNIDKTEVPLEVKEMIRKSLSPKKDEFRTPFTLDEVCNPPCSIWCNSVNKGTSLTSANTPSSLAQDPDDFEDTQLLDLISLEQPDSEEEPIKLSLKPTLNLSGNKIKSDHNLFSFSEWDSFFDTKYDIGVASRTSSLTSKDKIAFIQKDPLTSKSLGSGSLEGADSGFVSRSSSEDLFGETSEKESTWKLVNSEDSLWKPLPECFDTNNAKMHYQKRAPDFRFIRTTS